MHKVPSEVGETSEIVDILGTKTCKLDWTEVEVEISSPNLLESALATTFSLPCLYSTMKA